MSQTKGEPLRWTVSVLGRTARGLGRDYTSCHTNESRDEAEADAIADAKARFLPSTEIVRVASYAQRAGNYRETLRERILDEEGVRSLG